MSHFIECSPSLAAKLLILKSCPTDPKKRTMQRNGATWPNWLPQSAVPSSNLPATVAASEGYPRTYPTTVPASAIQHTPNPSLGGGEFSNMVLPAAGRYPQAAQLSGTLGRSYYGNAGQSNHRKPGCSYNCLIAMSMMARGGVSLPVSEIYKYIE